MTNEYLRCEPEEQTREEALEGQLYEVYRGAMICKISMEVIDKAFSEHISAWDDDCTLLFHCMSKGNQKILTLSAWAETNRVLSWYKPLASELDGLYMLVVDLHNAFCKVMRLYTDLRNQENKRVLSFEDLKHDMDTAQFGINLMRTAIDGYMDLREDEN